MESIFDGWTRQIVKSLDDDRGGFCARGWIRHYYGIPQDINGRLYAQVAEAEERIGGWIAQNLPVPECWRGTPGAAIAWANNTRLLDIEGFRMVDLLTRGYIPEEPEDMPEETKPPEEIAVPVPPEVLVPAA